MAFFGFHGEHTDAVQWWRSGRCFDLSARGGLSAALATICDNWERRVYPVPLGLEPRQRCRPPTGSPSRGSLGRLRVGLLTRAPTQC